MLTPNQIFETLISKGPDYRNIMLCNCIPRHYFENDFGRDCGINFGRYCTNFESNFEIYFGSDYGSHIVGTFLDMIFCIYQLFYHCQIWLK